MSMMATQSPGAALNSLACEALALIASQLEPPDRQSLAQSCSSGQHAVIISTCRLTLPGSQVLAGLHHGDRFCCDGACCSTANCACACSMGTSSFTPAAAALHKDGYTSTSSSSSSSSEVSALHTACSAESLERLDPSSWLQRYTGVQSLTVTSCDSCQVPRTPRAVICSHSPRSPSTPADRDCSRPCGPGLASFLAAAGSSMPYLHKLDLSCACSCLAAPPCEVLATIATSCPRLTALSLPSWLLRIPAAGIRQHSSRKGFSSRTARKARTPTGGLAAPELNPINSGGSSSSSSDHESSGDRQLLPYQHPTDSQDAYGSPVCACAASASHLPLRKQLPQQQQWLQEHLSMLAPLCHLASLSLVGSAPPPAAFAELSVLTRLHSFSLQVTESSLRWPSPLSSVPTWPGGLPDSNTHSSSSSSHSSGKHSYSSGTVLGNSLAKLTALTSLALSGTEHASDTLRALSGMPQLAKVEICSLSDFSVSSLASLSGLTGLTHLRVHGCSALQSTARSALPLQLQCLQEMCVLDFDFDLHLRDLQVLCLLKRLSHLTATSFHHCIHLMPSLELPSLRCLRISHVSRLALQQQPQQQQQQQQQQAAPVAVQVVQALAGQPFGGPAAAAGPPVGVGNLAAAVAAGAVPVIPLSALPVFVNLHQQQQEEHAQYLLVGPQGQPALLRQQQQPSAGAGTAISIQPHANHLPLHAPGYGPQVVTQAGAAAAGVAALQQQQQPVLPNGISLQLLQLRQQQLYLQQQQLRLQEQQVQLQLQQMQAQLLQQGQQPHQHAAFNGAAADFVGAQQQQQQPQPLAALIMQQGPAGPAAAPAAAAPAAANGAVPCVQHKGWLAVLFPGLEELQLASVREFPPALPALQGHQSLQKLVIGTYRPVQQQQQSARRGKVVAFPQAGVLAGMVTRGTGSRVFGLQGAASAPGGCVGAHWGMLRTLPCLEELVIHEAGVVLGSTPWVLGAAVSGQLCRLVLNDAAGLADLAAAALLGAYSWKKLEQLEIEGAKGLTHRGLNCLTGLPALKHLTVSHCSSITASGLASLLLSSGSMKQLDLLCCAGVKPSEAQAVQDAVWAVSKRRVVVTWRCHDCRQA